ncbi:hypothetical protein CC2G_002747 [Coprinopsis cinerea AmutBmut pab1-1]|nr:hypothetical protein CC2G_002747 [Coprinopsis cinerea AmutBmut pab1-1]
MSDAERAHRTILTIASVNYTGDVISTIGLGLQMFMAIYGLTVYLDTPLEAKKGRLPYIIISFIIFILSAIDMALNHYLEFRKLFYSEGVLDYLRTETQL